MKCNFWGYLRISSEQEQQESMLIQRVKLLERLASKKGFSKTEVEAAYKDVYIELLNLYQTVALRLYRRKKK